MDRFHVSLWAAIIAMAVLLGSWSATAQTPVCDKLNPEKKAIASKILKTAHPYACCDETIEKCIQKKSPCALAIRLANRVCTLVAKGESEQKIYKRLQKRAESMNSHQPKTTIDVTAMKPAGESTAPVEVVVYACARCPFCSKLVPALYEEVTSGRLKGKVRLYFKPFPLKSHEFSKEGGLAMMAAADLGKFWEFTLHMYKNFDLFCVDKLAEWAEVQGMDKEKFKQLMASANTRKALVDSKKEGLANGVKATPQLFIDGKKYTGFLDLDEVVDIMLEESENQK